MIDMYNPIFFSYNLCLLKIICVLQEFVAEIDRFTLAKRYFDLREYDRAAHFVQHCTSNKAYFLYMYARYLSGEKKRLDDTADSSGELGNSSCWG